MRELLRRLFQISIASIRRRKMKHWKWEKDFYDLQEDNNGNENYCPPDLGDEILAKLNHAYSKPKSDILQLAVEESQIDHEPEYQTTRLVNNNVTQDQVKSIISQPYKQDTLARKSKTQKKIYNQFRNLNLYLEKAKLCSPYRFQFNEQIFEIHYADLQKFVKDGNILSIVTFLLKLTLGDCLDEYTLTGCRQLTDPITGKSRKCPGTAKKMPEDLKVNIKDYIRQMEFLIYHQDITDNLDAYINTVFTKAFNRRQNMIKKRIDAAAAGKGKTAKNRKNVI